MSRDRIAKGWRKLLIDKLKDYYGVADEEAQAKVEMWLRRIKQQPSVQPRNLTAAKASRKRSPFRVVAVRSGESRSADAAARR